MPKSALVPAVLPPRNVAAAGAVAHQLADALVDLVLARLGERLGLAGPLVLAPSVDSPRRRVVPRDAGEAPPARKRRRGRKPGPKPGFRREAKKAGRQRSREKVVAPEAPTPTPEPDDDAEGP